MSNADTSIRILERARGSKRDQKRLAWDVPAMLTDILDQYGMMNFRQLLAVVAPVKAWQESAVRAIPEAIEHGVWYARKYGHIMQYEGGVEGVLNDIAKGDVALWKQAAAPAVSEMLAAFKEHRGFKNSRQSSPDFLSAAQFYWYDNHNTTLILPAVAQEKTWHAAAAVVLGKYPRRDFEGVYTSCSDAFDTIMASAKVAPTRPAATSSASNPKPEDRA